MIHELSGGSKKNPDEYYGRVISEASLDEDKDRVVLRFQDGTAIKIWDNVQPVSEDRYISTDDDLQDLVGRPLIDIDACEGPTIEDGYDEHETAFVKIQTDRNVVVLVTHNEHNGYYGGFGLSIDEL